MSEKIQKSQQSNIHIFAICSFGATWLMEVILIILDKMGLVTEAGVAFSFVMALAVMGPGIGAFLVWKKNGEISGFKDYMKRSIGSVGWKTAVITTLGTMAVLWIVDFCLMTRTSEKWFMFIVYIPYMIVGGGLEEFGWRGFLYPYLKKKCNVVITIFAIGIIWACWHIPLWFISYTSQASENFITFLVLCICFSIVLGVVYEITENTLACVLVHAWFNVLFSMYQMNLGVLSLKTLLPLMIQALIMICVYGLIKNRIKYTHK